MTKTDLIKRSIFIQKTYLKRYLPTVSHQQGVFQMYSTKKQYDLALQEKLQKVLTDPRIEYILQKEEEIFTCNLPLPLLKNDEHFYIEEQNKTVIIKSHYRTSTDSVIYEVEPLIIEDEQTLSTYNNMVAHVKNTLEGEHFSYWDKSYNRILDKYYFLLDFLSKSFIFNLFLSNKVENALREFIDSYKEVE